MPAIERAEGFALQFRSRFPNLFELDSRRMPHEMGPSMVSLLYSPQAKVRRVQALRSEYARAIDHAGLIPIDEAIRCTREHFRPIMEHPAVRKHPKLQRQLRQIIDGAAAQLRTKAI